MDVKVNNPPQCQGLYDQALDLIQDLNIYDLYRTQYPYTGLLNKRNRLQHQQRHALESTTSPLKDFMTGYLQRMDVR